METNRPTFPPLRMENRSRPLSHNGFHARMRRYMQTKTSSSVCRQRRIAALLVFAVPTALLAHAPDLMVYLDDLRIRSAGTIHVAIDLFISLQHAPRTSPLRAAVRMANRSARAPTPC